MKRKKKVKNIGGEKCAANGWKSKKEKKMRGGGLLVNINADTFTVTLVGC